MLPIPHEFLYHPTEQMEPLLQRSSNAAAALLLMLLQHQPTSCSVGQSLLRAHHLLPIITALPIGCILGQLFCPTWDAKLALVLVRHFEVSEDSFRQLNGQRLFNCVPTSPGLCSLALSAGLEGMHIQLCLDRAGRCTCMPGVTNL